MFGISKREALTVLVVILAGRCFGDLGARDYPLSDALCNGSH